MGRRAAGFLIFRRFNSDIQYLMLKASYGSRHWTPPKGHVDPGEDDFTTALRETQEEAGYTQKDLNIYKDKQKILKYKVKGVDKIVIYWLAELINPEQKPILSDEHTEYKWLNKDDTISIAGYNDFEEMLQYFDNEIKLL